MCAFCPGRLRRRNDRGRFNTSSPFEASVDVTDARGRVRNPDKPSRASGGLMKPPARALSRYRPIIGTYVASRLGALLDKKENRRGRSVYRVLGKVLTNRTLLSTGSMGRAKLVPKGRDVQQGLLEVVLLKRGMLENR